MPRNVRSRVQHTAALALHYAEDDAVRMHDVLRELVELDAVMYFRAVPLPAAEPHIPTLESTPFTLRLDLLLLGKRW